MLFNVLRTRGLGYPDQLLFNRRWKCHCKGDVQYCAEQVRPVAFPAPKDVLVQWSLSHSRELVVCQSLVPLDDARVCHHL